MKITVHINENRRIGERSLFLYGHFLEHFHRQVYDGIFDPKNPLSDEDGFRKDIIEAMRKIHVPILRWPGGCFVSAYHWKDGVGKDRIPCFDKAWRVEDPNTFGTDEYIKLCRKIGCEPYICTNAGTGTAEEMSDWVEYCNLETWGKFARQRIQNGYPSPHRVKYWSIGNENYGSWEIGAKTSSAWGPLVREAAKMIKHVDPTTELSAAALADIDWNVNLLKTCGPYLDWISVHGYWDMMAQENNPANYEACMAYTGEIAQSLNRVRGILNAMGLEKQIKIAYDEWNLRCWHHPNVHTIQQGINQEDYLTPRDKNDINSTYTMADAVFSACFLNEMNRNCDIVGMANFAPILNTRGCIYSYPEGIVLRSTYHVFDLYVNYMGNTVTDLWIEENPEMKVTTKDGRTSCVNTLDLLATTFKNSGKIALSAVNKHPSRSMTLALDLLPDHFGAPMCVFSLNGNSPDDHNDIGRSSVQIEKKTPGSMQTGCEIELPPHSVNVIQIG